LSLEAMRRSRKSSSLSTATPRPASVSRADRRLRVFAVAQNFEPDELIYVTGRERSLVELHPELLHSIAAH